MKELRLREFKYLPNVTTGRKYGSWELKQFSILVSFTAHPTGNISPFKMELTNSSFWIFRHLQRKKAEETGLSLRWSLAFLGVYFCTFWIWYQGLPYQLKTTINNFYFQPQSLVTFRGIFPWCLPLDVLQDLKVLRPKLSFWSSP